MPETPRRALAEAVAEASVILAEFHGQAGLRRLKPQLLRKRRGLHRLLPVVERLQGSRSGLGLLVLAALIVYPGRWFRRGTIRVYAVSLTTNNARALERLHRVASDDGPLFRLNDAPAGILRRMRALRKIPQLARVLEMHRTQEPFVVLHQAMAAAAGALFEEDLVRTAPRMILVANDHSPATVALLALGRSMQISTCYVQHGPVTEAFPPLQHDLSVLANKQALMRYERAADVRQQARPESETVCILPTILEKPLPMRTPRASLTVCIALSYFPDLPALQDLVEQLDRHPAVDQIIVCLHPRSRLQTGDKPWHQKVSRFVRGGEIRDLATVCDLCLVSNSGVALEFLHYGCPTYYWPSGDHAGKDYYGFVQDEVLPVFEEHLLDVPEILPRYFDADWTRRFETFAPLVAADAEHLCAETRAKLKIILEKGT